MSSHLSDPQLMKLQSIQHVLTDLPVDINAVPWNSLARVLLRCSGIDNLQIDLDFCRKGYGDMVKIFNGLTVNECEFSSLGRFNVDQR